MSSLDGLLEWGVAATVGGGHKWVPVLFRQVLVAGRYAAGRCHGLQPTMDGLWSSKDLICRARGGGSGP